MLISWLPIDDEKRKYNGKVLIMERSNCIENLHQTSKNKNMNKHFLALLIAAGFLLIGCQDEQQVSETNTNKNQIAQHWVLTDAERNGKKTETLRDAYFDLKADGSGVINLDGNAQNAQWDVEGNYLKISETQSDFLSTDYTVSNLQDSTMTLSVELRKTAFVMNFVIAEEEEEKVDSLQ